METKLRLWRETNGKTLGKNSPQCFASINSRSPYVVSPSRFHPLNRQVPHRKLIADQKISTYRRVHSPCIEAPSGESKTEEILATQSTEEKCDGVKKDEKEDLDATRDEGKDDKENRAVGFSTPVIREFGSLESPPLSERLRILGRALREALSPVASNDAYMEGDADISSQCYTPTPSKCRAIFKTPDTQHDTPCAWTPLEKFNTSTRDYQGILVKDYIEILNTGSREELLQLKGIGAKRADYILKLRETSGEPFKELRDLEKIGVSARQACEIFKSNVVRQVSSATR